MEGYIDVLELTVIALGALLLISICFVGLTRGLQWGTGLGKRGRRSVKRKAIIAAAVRSYLDLESKR